MQWSQMVNIIPFKCFYPISLTDFALPMIFSDVDISPDVKSIDDNEIFKIPANILTDDHKRIFQETLTLGHARKYEFMSRYWSSYEALGFFREDPDDLFYVYKMEYTLNGVRYHQTGLICLLELKKQTILGHEETIHDKINDQLKRLKQLRTSISPVFLLYDDENNNHDSSFTFKTNESNDNELINLLEEVTYSFPIIDLIATNNVRHTLWKIIDSKISSKIIEYFNMQTKVYIADGHHRVESSFALRDKLKKENPNHTGKEPYNYILSAIFPVSQVHILEYNRILKNVKKFRKDVLPKLKKNFSVDELSDFQKPTHKGQFVIYSKGKWFKVKPKDKIINNKPKSFVNILDSYVIQEYIFGDIFNIKNVRKSRKIIYIPGSKSIEYLIDTAEREGGIAIVLPAVGIDDILTIADNGQIVPPKTTWFEPKILKGLMFWKF